MPELTIDTRELISPTDTDKDELLVPVSRVHEFMQQETNEADCMRLYGNPFGPEGRIQRPSDVIRHVEHDDDGHADANTEENLRAAVDAIGRSILTDAVGEQEAREKAGRAETARVATRRLQEVIRRGVVIQRETVAAAGEAAADATEAELLARVGKTEVTKSYEARMHGAELTVGRSSGHSGAKDAAATSSTSGGAGVATSTGRRGRSTSVY